MDIFVISDTHFGHKNLAEKYNSRPREFESKIISNWHKIINPEDIVIHLGDVVVGGSSDWQNIVFGLPGQKILIKGNHDERSYQWYMSNGFDFCCSQFYWELFGLRIVFSHEPFYDGKFDINIHGHLHDGRHEDEFKLDRRHFLISLERTKFQPRSLESLVKEWKKNN